MAKKSSHQSGTPALQILDAAGVDYQLVEYEHSDVMDHGYALDTVEVLGLDPATVFKTLLAEVDGKPAVGIVPADSRLGLKALAKAVGGKNAQMMDPSKAEKLTGYVTGGISPLGQKRLFPTVIDATAQALDSMIVSGGKRTLSVSLAPADLAALTKATFAEILALS